MKTHVEFKDIKNREIIVPTKRVNLVKKEKGNEFIVQIIDGDFYYITEDTYNILKNQLLGLN